MTKIELQVEYCSCLETTVKFMSYNKLVSLELYAFIKLLELVTSYVSNYNADFYIDSYRRCYDHTIKAQGITVTQYIWKLLYLVTRQSKNIVTI